MIEPRHLNFRSSLISSLWGFWLAICADSMNQTMLLAIVVNIAFLLSGMSYGGPLSSFFDLPSVLILFFPVFLSVSGTHGFGHAIAALRAIAIDPKPTEAKVLARVSESFGRLFMTYAWVAILIGLVHMLRQIDNPEVIGEATSVLLLCLFYALLMRAVVFTPLTDKLNRIAETT